MPLPLAEQAQQFAQNIERLLNDTVSSTATVSVLTTDPGIAVVVAGEAETFPQANKATIPLTTCDRPEEADPGRRLWLKAFFQLRLDDEGEHMAVARSGFGLCIDPVTCMCPIRIEYDRDKTTKQQAHVQIHGESSGVAWAMNASGQPMRRLEKLHIPVGGRRFRPSLEDFIEFLHQEGFIPDVHQGWGRALDASRGDWEERQLRAAVRRSQAGAADQLRKHGWTVTPPTTPISAKPNARRKKRRQ